MSADPDPTLYALALALNAAVYRATFACPHGETDQRVRDLRRLAVALAPTAKRAMSGASPEEAGGLRAGLADLLEQVEEACELGLVGAEAADDLLTRISTLSRALTQLQQQIFKPAG